MATTAQAVPQPTATSSTHTQWRWLPRLRAALGVMPFLVLIALTFVFAQTDPDYWWHQRTGQLILALGQLPRTDPFSFTSLGQPWITHEWLTEVCFAFIAAHFGYVGNVVLYGTITALAALAIRATCRLRGLGPAGATGIMLWAFAIILPLANVRPQMVTILFLALTALIVTAYLQGEARGLWILPPLFVLWVNLHGGYVIGLVLLGLTLLGETAARYLGRPAAPLRPLLLTTALSGAATLVSPLGVEALRYPFTYAGTGNASQRFIAEWQSPNFHNAAFYPLAASLLVGLLIGIGRGKPRPTELLWTALFSALALQSIRHTPLYAIVVLPLLGVQLASIAPSWPGVLTRWRAPARLILPVSGWLLLLIGTITLVAGSAALPLQTGTTPRVGGYPTGAVTFLRAHPEAQGNLFNTYSWGGYLIAELYPDRLVSIDGRADVHGDALVTQHRAAERLMPGWRDTLDTWQIGLVLIDRDGPLATALRDDPAWQELYAGDVERLFARR